MQFKTGTGLKLWMSFHRIYKQSKSSSSFCFPNEPKFNKMPNECIPQKNLTLQLTKGAIQDMNQKSNMTNTLRTLKNFTGVQEKSVTHTHARTAKSSFQESSDAVKDFTVKSLKMQSLPVSVTFQCKLYYLSVA